MRKLLVSNLISLDGYFEGPNKEIDWFMVEENFFTYARDLLENVDGVVFGRVTYQLMAEFWPNDVDNDPAITHKMNHLPKYVFSQSLDRVDWTHSVLVKGDLTEEVNKLKQQPGKDLVIFGSGKLVSSMTNLNLIDEYRLIVNPVILGSGHTLFQGVKNKITMELIETKTLKSGAIILYYRPISGNRND